MRKITRLFPALLLISLTAFSQVPQLEEIIKEANVPGIQLIYTIDNKPREYNAGVIKDGSDKKITSNTIFEAASLSKTVFAYAVLRLYDRGIINLDSPLLDYIATYERFKSSNPRYRKITARMALKHTTGLPNWGDDSTVNLLFTPDSCFNYSGEGYLFLQRVVEKILHEPLNNIMQQEVFTPLKMESSSYMWDDRFDTLSSFGNGQEEINRHKNANAAYSLLTNAKDYNIFLQALLTGKGLKSNTHKMMFAVASQANRFDKPANIADQYIDWGLGLGLQQNEKGKAIWHWGDNGNFKCFYMAFPGKNESLIYFTHSQNGLSIIADVLNLFFGKQTCWAMKWLEYGYDSPLVIKAFHIELMKRGFDHAFEVATEKKKYDARFQLTEHDLNSFGYLLLQEGKKKEALEVFKLNTRLYPGSWNVYDSEGEAYEDIGDRENAIKNYKRSIELNPKNTNGIEHLKKLSL